MYRWIEHAAELELAIDAKQVVVVEAGDPETPLAECLSELVRLVETADFVPERIDELALRPTFLWARVRGRRGHPAPFV